MTAARLAKHAAVLVVAVLAAIATSYFYATMCMFSDENEMACTDASQQFVAGVTVVTVATAIYGLWGLMLLCRSTLVRT